ncbi:MAG TPA: FkbM family methyltransferase [Pyrinomonadaceae bacterium]
MNLSDIPAGTLIGRILRQPLKLIPGNTAMPILQGRLRGKRWIAGAHTHGCWLGSYESEKQKLFESVVQPGSVVLDIGANAGFYTLLASSLVCPEGRVYAFEPLPRNVRFLKEHLRLNKVTNVEVIEVAVSDQSGEVFFDDTAGSAMGQVATTGRLKVRTVRIDEFTDRNECQKPHCLKIDVEGHELAVLQGAASTLATCRPSIFLSTHSKSLHRDCCQLLRSHGYSLRPVLGTNVDETDEILAI